SKLAWREAAASLLAARRDRFQTPWFSLDGGTRPLRRAGNWLVLRAGRPGRIVEQWGKRLTVWPAPAARASPPPWRVWPRSSPPIRDKAYVKSLLWRSG